MVFCQRQELRVVPGHFQTSGAEVWVCWCKVSPCVKKTTSPTGSSNKTLPLQIKAQIFPDYFLDFFHFSPTLALKSFFLRPGFENGPKDTWKNSAWTYRMTWSDLLLDLNDGQSFCHQFLVDPAEVGHFLLAFVVNVHAAFCTNKTKHKPVNLLENIQQMCTTIDRLTAVCLEIYLFLFILKPCVVRCFWVVVTRKVWFIAHEGFRTCYSSCSNPSKPCKDLRAFFFLTREGEISAAGSAGGTVKHRGVDRDDLQVEATRSFMFQLSQMKWSLWIWKISFLCSIKQWKKKKKHWHLWNHVPHHMWLAKGHCSPLGYLYLIIKHKRCGKSKSVNLSVRNWSAGRLLLKYNDHQLPAEGKDLTLMDPKQV